ncbi:4Fe-4S double cluster binding domain-containing protein [Thermoproteota archaeon]
MGEFKEELEDYAHDLGMDLFGVANLTGSKAHSLILRQGGEHISGFPISLSLGIRLLDPIVDQLYRHEEPSAIYSYRGLYNSANANLDRAALLVAKKIQEAGFNAYPIPASQTINDRKLEGAISHKLSAHLSGLGWIGKSCLLITPEYGPRIRFVTVLTDAPFDAGKPIKNECGDCRECVDICPPGAFTGVAFDPSEPRDVRFRAHQCRDYTQRRAQQLGEGICGLCVYVCPYGLKKK